MTHLLVLLAVVSTGAGPQGSPEVLTLDAALARADEANADLKAARARLEVAEVKVRQVWAGYLPQLSAGGSYMRNSDEAKLAFPTGYYIRDVMAPQGPPFDPSREVSADNPPGLPTSHVLFPSGFSDTVIQSRHQWGAQAELKQAIFAPLLIAGISTANHLAELSRHQTQAVRSELLFAVAQAYYGVVGLKESIAVQERLLAVQRAREEQARVKHEAGAVPRMDFLRARIDRERAELDLERSRHAYRGARSGLSVLLDRDDAFEVVRPGPSSKTPDDPKATLAQALDERADLKASRAALELAELGRPAVWGSYLPNLGLSAQYRVSNTKGFTGQNDSWAVVLGLSWTLWDGGVREAQLAEASAELRRAQAQLRGAEARATDEVRRAFWELDSARASQAKAEKSLELAKENDLLVRTAYDSGAVPYINVSDASAVLLGSELTVITETLNHQLAALKVLKAAGAFEPAAVSHGATSP